MPGAIGLARSVLTVCLVGGPESLTKATLGLLVQVADLHTQAGDDGFELRTSLKKFQALGDQRGHRFRASFLDLVSGPVVQFLAERDTDLLGHTWNHTTGRPAASRPDPRRSRPGPPMSPRDRRALRSRPGCGPPPWRAARRRRVCGGSPAW